MSDLPRYWQRVAEPEAGIYQLVTIAGWDVGGDPANRKVLYVVKSLEGLLTEAFEWREVGTVWRWVHGPEARARIRSGKCKAGA